MEMELAGSRLHPSDALTVGAIGLCTRKLRTTLSAVGISIGVASIVAVLGISDSSKADLLAQLDKLGTNLLTVKAGQSLLGRESELPPAAAKMLARIGPVTEVSAIRHLDATVRRTDFIHEAETGGIRVMSADTNLVDTLQGSLAEGVFFNEATSRYPTIVLGAIAAQRLGISDVSGQVRVWLEGRWFTVVGILRPLVLAPDVDTSVIVGLPVARKVLGAGSSASAIYVRARQDAVEAVRDVLGATANPKHPEEVAVSRPSDALEARAAAKSAFTSLFLGLGVVALLVAGVGIANVMIMSVLERRSEIGLRRALGATKRHVWLQFLTESATLSLLGGLGGVAMGVAVSAAYAAQRGWSVVVPAAALVGSLAIALVVGAIAGFYPAVRAARLAPTEALRTT